MNYEVQEDSTVLVALQRIHPQSSITTLRKMLTQGRVQVNETVVHRAKQTVTAGDRVRISSRQQAEEHAPQPKATPSVDLEVVFEDDAILVVNKPNQLLSVATDRLEMDTLHSRCVEHVQLTDERAWCYIVHRLDRDTSGIMVLAKTKEAKEDLQSQFSERTVHRTYIACVEGHPTPSSGTVRSWLVEDKHLNVKAVNKNHPNGKEAISHYRVLDSGERNSLVEVLIETGRRHQIRMAMQHLGTPVVGDERHGANTNPHGRVMLHASSLEFLHPETEDPVRFETPLPRTFSLDG